MSLLRQKMAENGFESNESYDYVIKCLQSAPLNTIPCLNIEGKTGRHKTAFASALAQSLDAVHVLYHDFTQEENITTTILVTQNNDDTDGKKQPPVLALDRIFSDACALSEAEKTILILDQLHIADFKDHIRLYQFLMSHEWTYYDTTFYANPKNLLLFIISEELIYHSLQKQSFRVWVASSSSRTMPYHATDFQLNENANALLNNLNALFNQLELMPTYSEYRKIIHDIQHNMHTSADLCTSIYGWAEGVNREKLQSQAIQSFIQENVMPVIEAFIGIDESVELSSDNLPCT